MNNEIINNKTIKLNKIKKNTDESYKVYEVSSYR